jgi:hypothetical protein
MEPTNDISVPLTVAFEVGQGGGTRRTGHPASVIDPATSDPGLSLLPGCRRCGFLIIDLSKRRRSDITIRHIDTPQTRLLVTNQPLQEQRAQVALAVEHRQHDDLVRLDPIDDPPGPLDELAVLKDIHGLQLRHHATTLAAKAKCLSPLL